MIVSPHITAQLSNERKLGFEAAAASRRGSRRRLNRGRGQAPVVPAGEIVIRRAAPADGSSLARLAEVDGKHLPDGPFLLAEVEGEPQAALSLAGGVAVADPFRPTAVLVSLLAVRAGQLAA
ncbi:MAG: hypothetical protein QOI98_2246 [Solirubrobacteraceae bacterium]|jgi:hypothetical protein|nr:hypothetical protein [Solirubrobacteraceae bacterium]